MSFTYARTAGGERDARTIQPNAVHSHEGRYYAWGVVECEQSPKLFAIDRMRDVGIETDVFNPDPGFDLNDALRYSFGTMVADAPAQNIVVRFTAEVAAFVQCRRWPAKSDIEERNDGSVALTFTVTRIEELVA